MNLTPFFGGHETVLLVEDNDLVRDYAKAQLFMLGYDVITAENGHEALDVIRARADIDLLFTDMVMPGGLNGRELAEQARLIRPGLRVLVTSGYDSEAFGQDADISARHIMLPKPYTRAALAECVRRALTG